uniref:Uncharacterized protein n=1 Tax=Anguilla anguilla TaxID=7936 RepID=A0A0E9S4M0_ANGAN
MHKSLFFSLAKEKKVIFFVCMCNLKINVPHCLRHNFFFDASPSPCCSISFFRKLPEAK